MCKQILDKGESVWQGHTELYFKIFSGQTSQLNDFKHLTLSSYSELLVAIFRNFLLFLLFHCHKSNFQNFCFHHIKKINVLLWLVVPSLQFSLLGPELK
jgi:hypothetical protein